MTCGCSCFEQQGCFPCVRAAIKVHNAGSNTQPSLWEMIQITCGFKPNIDFLNQQLAEKQRELRTFKRFPGEAPFVTAKRRTNVQLRVDGLREQINQYHAKNA